MNDTDRQTLLSTAFHDVETIVAGHAMRQLSLASYDVLLRTDNPLVKGEMPKDGTPEFTSAIMGSSSPTAPRGRKSCGLRSTIRDSGRLRSSSAAALPRQISKSPSRAWNNRAGNWKRPRLKPWGISAKKAPPCDEPGFLAAQVFAVAAETGWTEERILFMPLARLAQYQHCLLRRNGVRTNWSSAADGLMGLTEQLQALQRRWIGTNSD